LPTTATGWSRVPAQPSVTGVQFQQVVWTGTRFVALASAGDGAGTVILDSPDGLTWNRQSTAAADELPAALAAGSRGVVALVASDDHVAAWFSPDGLAWTERPDAIPAPATAGADAAPTLFTVKGLVATETGWLAVGREDPVCQLDCGTDPVRPLAWSSADGLTWTSIPAVGSAGGMDAVTRGTDGFVAVGLGKSRAAVWTSPEGATWTPVADSPIFRPRPASDPSFWVEMNGVAADHGVVVAVGNDGPQGGGDNSARAWWSADGRTWSEATGQWFEGGQVFGLASTPNGFVAVGPSMSSRCIGGIWESADGRAWTCAASEPAFAGFGPYAAAASPSVVIAVGLDAAGPDSDEGFPGAVWMENLR
jgi:hypothetical protein